MLKIVFYTEFSLEFGGGGTFISLWVFIPQILAGYKKNLATSPADNFQLPVRKCSNVWFEACTWTWCWWWVPQRSPTTACTQSQWPTTATTATTAASIGTWKNTTAGDRNNKSRTHVLGQVVGGLVVFLPLRFSFFPNNKHMP